MLWRGGELGAVEEREPLSQCQIAAGKGGRGGLAELRGVVNRVLHACSSSCTLCTLFWGAKVVFFERQGVYQKARPSGACSPPRRWPLRGLPRRSEPLAPCSGEKNGSREWLSSSLCGLCMVGRYAACAWACGGWQAATRGPLWRAARRPVWLFQGRYAANEPT